MTANKYFEICEQMKEAVDYDKIPPELEDFPDDVQLALLTFNKLGDRIVVDIGYLGKDYTSLPLHMEVLPIENKEIFLETLLRLDQRMIEKSAEAMKQERDKIKRSAKK